MNILELAAKNILKKKTRYFLLVILVTLAFTFIIIINGLSNIIDRSYNEQMAAAKQQNVISVIPRIAGSEISETILQQLRETESVISVFPQYHISALLEDEDGLPIYNVTINQLDVGTELPGVSMTHAEKPGVILPNLTVNLNRTIILKDYVGQTINILYDAKVGTRYETRKMSVTVTAVYNTVGMFEENPIYLSYDLCQQLYLDMNPQGLAAKGAKVYVSNIDEIDRVASHIENTGFDTAYSLKSTKNLFATLQSARGVILAMSGILVVLSCVILTQSLNNSIQRREKTIGIMKAFGYENRKIISMVLYEICFCLLPAIILAPTLYTILKPGLNSILSAVSLSGNLPSAFSGLLILMGFSLLIMFGVMIKPLIKIKKLEAISILKGE